MLPSQLSSLGYLPDDVQLIVGIHVAEAWRTPMGRPFLDGSLPGGGGVGLEQIESVTGLKFAEIDHAVLAVKLDKEKVLPRVFLIVKTIQPYDRAKIREASQVGRARQRGSPHHRGDQDYAMENHGLPLVRGRQDARRRLAE